MCHSFHSSRSFMFTDFDRAGRLASVMAICFASTAAFAASSIDPPQAERVATTTASGVQVYSCEYNAQHQLGWVFKNPQATLYDTSGQAVIRHSTGPSWEADDGSRIVGHVLAQTPSETAAS